MGFLYPWENKHIDGIVGIGLWQVYVASLIESQTTFTGIKFRITYISYFMALHFIYCMIMCIVIPDGYGGTLKLGSD